MDALLFSVLFSALICSIAYGVEINAGELLQKLDKVQVLDFQTNYSRELNGNIEGSILIPDDLEDSDFESYIEKNIELQENVVYVSKDVKDPLFDSFDQIKTLEGYTSGMKNWIDVGGPVNMTKFITFQPLLDSLNGLSIVPVVLIDVRSERELYADGKIVGSYNIPIDKILEAFKGTEESFRRLYGFDKPTKDDLNVVLSCQGGVRARFADHLLTKLGYLHLRVYDGSFADWKANNGPIEPYEK